MLLKILSSNSLQLTRFPDWNWLTPELSTELCSCLVEGRLLECAHELWGNWLTTGSWVSGCYHIQCQLRFLLFVGYGNFFLIRVSWAHPISWSLETLGPDPHCTDWEKSHDACTATENSKGSQPASCLLQAPVDWVRICLGSELFHSHYLDFSFLHHRAQSSSFPATILPDPLALPPKHRNKILFAHDIYVWLLHGLGKGKPFIVISDVKWNTI